jgi:hypothetical protein
MRTLSCDVCKGTIQTPVSGRNYIHMAHRDICEPCHDKLSLQIRPVIRAKMPFNYDWYDHYVRESIEKAIVKGKFEGK